MQVTFSEPIQSMRGTLDKESGAYFITRNAKTFLCFRRQKRYLTLRGYVFAKMMVQLKSEF